MRKVKTNLALCSMLALTLATSTFNVSATSDFNTATMVALNTASSALANSSTAVENNKLKDAKFSSIDFSKFEEDDYKKYVGVSKNGEICFDSKYSYLFIREADTLSEYFAGTTSGFTKYESEYASISDYVNNSENYLFYGDSSFKYYIMGDLSELSANELFGNKPFKLLAYDSANDKFFNLGDVPNIESFKQGLNIDSKEVDFNPSTEITEGVVFDVSSSVTKNGAKIKVKYKADGAGTPFYGISAYRIDKDTEQEPCQVELYDGDCLEGEKTLDVDYNGTYKVCLYKTGLNADNPIYLSKEIKIKGIDRKDSEPEFKVSFDKYDSSDDDVIDDKKPKVSFKGKPKTADLGTSVELTMVSNEKANLWFNGVSSGKLTKTMKITVTDNGNYSYYALDEGGNKTSGVLKVDFFKENGAFSNNERDSFWDLEKTNTVPVANDTGVLPTKLPQTGSTGWYIFIIVGASLVCGGIFVLAKVLRTKKKTN